MSSKNDHTGDLMQTRAPSQAYKDGWDRIFGRPAGDCAEVPAERHICQFHTNYLGVCMKCRSLPFERKRADEA